jgi:two-component system response regulator AtoC
MVGSLKVLVVDDDPLFARALGRELMGSGADVAIVSDLPAAHRELKEGVFDVIILDYQLQDADGPSLLENWPGEKPLPPTILLSGVVGIRETVRAMRAGALDVIKKPATAHDILERFQRSSSEAPPASLDGSDIEALVGEHPFIESTRQAIGELSCVPQATVLIIGEPGTEKPIIARLIHRATAPERPFVPVNCASIPEPLFEAEFWGFGPLQAAASISAKAGTGTLFLDEIAAIPRKTQQRLVEQLRARALGLAPSSELQARVICAVNDGELEYDSLESQLRQLSDTQVIMVPPLRERVDDIGAIATQFLAHFATRHPASPKRITKSALAELHKYSWPGNVQELKAVVQHSAALCESPELGLSIVQAVLAHRTSTRDSRSGTRQTLNFRGSLPELEKAAILQAFRASGSNVSEAARLVGLPRSTVRDKLKKYGIR